jgi:Domain of unknown function (DUF222)/HNH endonuclease
MFEALTESIQTLDIPPLSPAVIEVAHQHATRLLKTARRLRDLPATRDAWLQGQLSGGQVEVIVTNVTNRRALLWADHETDIVPTLARLDVGQTATAMQTWAAKADAILDESEPANEPVAEVHLAQTLNGRAYLTATFDAENHDLIATGLRLADSGDLDIPHAQRQGQAMIDVFRFFADHQTDKHGKRHRPHVNVVITEPALAAGEPGRTLNGTPLPGLVLRKLTCDANIHRVITDGASSILDYGRATRTIPPALYTSLLLRDHGCRFPGCDRPGQWCDGHHIVHWEHGGTTNLTNLVLLCSKHHHRIHTPGWHIKLTPHATLEVTHPDGTTRTSDPPPLC